MTPAKIFTNGGSQAVRLPKKYRFTSKEVYVQPVKAGISNRISGRSKALLYRLLSFPLMQMPQNNMDTYCINWSNPAE